MRLFWLVYNCDNILVKSTGWSMIVVFFSGPIHWVLRKSLFEGRSDWYVIVIHSLSWDSVYTKNIMQLNFHHHYNISTFILNISYNNLIFSMAVWKKEWLRSLDRIACQRFFSVYCNYSFRSNNKTSINSGLNYGPTDEP